MRTKTQFMTRSALGAALTVALLYLASVLPTGRLAVIAVSSVCVVMVRLRCGRKWAAGCYVAGAGLSLLILPNKEPAVLFAALLGYYPLIKLETEAISKKGLRWLIRLGIFNIVFAVLYFAARDLLGLWFPGSGILMFAAANAGFIIYDYALTQVILIYLRKIDRRM